MEEIQFKTCQDSETLVPVSSVCDSEKVEPLNQEQEGSGGDESFVDSMLCDSGSRLIATGFTRSNFTG